MVVVCIITNIFLYYEFQNEKKQFQKVLLDVYGKEVERIIGKDFKNLFQKNLKNQDLTIIKNYLYEDNDIQNNEYIHNVVYASNNKLYLKDNNGSITIDLSNIQNILDDLSKGMFFYSVSINNTKILTNSLEDIKFENFITIVIANNMTLYISLAHNRYSPYLELSNQEIKSKVYRMISISFLFLIGLGWINYSYYKNKEELIVEREHKRNILEFIRQNKEYIIRCYEYSKKVQTPELNIDYFPIPIVHQKNEFEPKKIIIDQFVEEIGNYFYYYKLFYKFSKSKFDLTTSLDSNLLVPFDEEVFFQIIVSIIYNFMNFNIKSTDHRNVQVHFGNEKIIISSEGLKLNQEYAIKASEMIFHDTGNPYLLNFRQIFALFNKYNLKYNVLSQKQGTVIEVILLNLEQGQDAKVINLEKYRENKQK